MSEYLICMLMLVYLFVHSKLRLLDQNCIALHYKSKNCLDLNVPTDKPIKLA